MSKHTPGPWIQDKWGHVRQKNGPVVPFGAVTLAMSNNDEIRANDRLVCAAPDLLDALRDVISWVPGAGAWHTDAPIKAVERARAAIAKAEGNAT